ncbi:MAG: CoA-binding protein, partial [Fimbriimonadaceae bacterium]|nr:CoA-binding protein [Chitinophagales bacterium]
MKKTMVLGASQKPERYSNKAVRKLKLYGHEVVAIGKRKGFIGDVTIEDEVPADKDIHTITMYLNANN